jgi:rhodanese-related sulfurtransferase
MRELKKLFILLVLLPVMIGYVGCKEKATEPSPVINEAEELVKYVESYNNYVYDAASFVLDAAAYRTDYLAKPTKIHTIDLRAAVDYNAKRLKGAKNVTLAGLRTHLAGVNLDNFDRIVLVCYSGQTSAYAASLMRALYPLAQANKIVSLKFGMSSIDSSFAQVYWLARRGSARVAQFVKKEPPAKPAKGDLPKITTGKTAGKAILEARVDSLLAAGFSPIATISEATVYANLTNYFIMNYWPVALFRDPGAIDGAYNYDPAGKPFLLANDLKTIPTNKVSVLYCYTGQTSAYVGAYLRLIGYDVKSLLYGANSMIYDVMVAKPVINAFIPATDIKGYKDLIEP